MGAKLSKWRLSRLEPNYCELISYGGYGDLYASNSNNVAIKVISNNNLYNYKVINKSGELNENIRQLTKHTNLMAIYGIRNEGTFSMIFVEKLNGMDLFTYMHKFGPIQRDDIITKIINQLMCGLHHLHSNGIMHRDIKPENIFIVDCNDIRLKIIDYGLATNKCPNREKVGTIGYMAPEVYSGNSYNEKCDIWSSGKVLYDILYYPSSHLTNLMNNMLEINPVLRPCSSECINYEKYNITKTIIQKNL